MLALFVLTWFATLEQTVEGLQPMMRKYFDWKTLFFFPIIGKPFSAGPPEPMTVYFPMPSGFWLCALFTLNLTLGGLIKIRKGWKRAGNLLVHFSVVFLMVAAGVTHFQEDRGTMMLWEGDKSNYARDYFAEVIEISEMEEGKVSEVHVIDWAYLEKMRGDDERLFRMANLPFDLLVSDRMANAVAQSKSFRNPAKGAEIVDGFWLQELEREKNAELQQGGCVVELKSKDGESAGKALLAVRSYEPATVEFEGQKYLIALRKKLWPLPFTVQLDEFRVERDPGTNRAAAYESDVTRIEEASSEEVLIQMNEPMRKDGWTFFQASWGPEDEPNPEKYFSVFEVVNNPADQWPLYSLMVAMVGLFWQFGQSFVSFATKSKTPKKSSS
ncbi:MAG: cytochrome c biogenesis protein ResB [Verrucomicrobiota bacterium]